MCSLPMPCAGAVRQAAEDLQQLVKEQASELKESVSDAASGIKDAIPAKGIGAQKPSAGKVRLTHAPLVHTCVCVCVTVAVHGVQR